MNVGSSLHLVPQVIACPLISSLDLFYVSMHARPKPECSDASPDDFDADSFVELYKSVFEDKGITFEEGQEVQAFFASHPVPIARLVSTRAIIFRTASSYWSEDGVGDNQNLLRCIDVIVYYFEAAYLDAKPYTLAITEEEDIYVEVCGLVESLSKAVQKLFDLDANRLEPGDDYAVNVQGGKKSVLVRRRGGRPTLHVCARA
jgi:hypothetical protein